MLNENYKNYLEMLLEAISYAYYKTDGTYGSLSPVVADKVRYINKQLYKELPKEEYDNSIEDEIDKWFSIVRDEDGNAHISSRDGNPCDDWKKNNYIINKPAFYDFARHFANLGRKQVLKEIYDGEYKVADKITAKWLKD